MDSSGQHDQALGAAESSDEPPRFWCETIQGALGGSWVEVAGELDLCSAPRLERELLAAPATARLVVLDLRDLTFIDCSGVHVILRARGRLHRQGRRLILLRGPVHVDRVFALTATEAALEFLDVDVAAPAVRRLLRAATRPEPHRLHLVDAPASGTALQ